MEVEVADSLVSEQKKTSSAVKYEENELLTAAKKRGRSIKNLTNPADFFHEPKCIGIKMESFCPTGVR